MRPVLDSELAFGGACHAVSDDVDQSEQRIQTLHRTEGEVRRLDLDQPFARIEPDDDTRTRAVDRRTGRDPADGQRAPDHPARRIPPSERGQDQPGRLGSRSRKGKPEDGLDRRTGGRRRALELEEHRDGRLWLRRKRFVPTELRERMIERFTGVSLGGPPHAPFEQLAIAFVHQCDDPRSSS